MVVFTIGHGRRPLDELFATLTEAEVQTLVDVRRYPGSKRNPQFNQRPLAEAAAEAGLEYRHEVELGGLRSDEPGAERFACLRLPAFRSYAARMSKPEYQQALERSLAAPAPAFMCSETPWTSCHRRFIAELLTARGHEIVHLIRPGEREPHRPHREADHRDGQLYLCGTLVA